MSVLNQSGEEQVECPLCMEPLEVDDLNFFPCTCGYQICRFCWHRIRTDENGLCPACRKAYSEDPADFIPLSKEQVAQLKAEKRQRDQQRKAKLSESRKHLASVRVVQRNLVFVVGLPMRLADAEVLKKYEYFGKFGKIHKVVINQSTSYAGTQGPSASAYVTYMKSDDALRAIQNVNNTIMDGKTIKTSLGTTKYCSHFMKNQPCPKPDCMYLHDFGDQEASFTKEQMHAGKHQEYEKKLHDALLSRLASQTGTNGGGVAPEPQQQQKPAGGGGKQKEASMTSSSSSSGSSTSSQQGAGKDNWPQLNTGEKLEKKDKEKAEKDKKGKKAGKAEKKKEAQLAAVGKKSPPPAAECVPREFRTKDDPSIEERVVAVKVEECPPSESAISKLPVLDDNSSFFSQNSFTKIAPDGDADGDSCLIGGHDEPLLEINDTDSWEFDFGYTKHSNHLEELAKLRTDVKDTLETFGNSFGLEPFGKLESAPSTFGQMDSYNTENLLETLAKNSVNYVQSMQTPPNGHYSVGNGHKDLNGGGGGGSLDQHMSKFFTDFYKKGFSAHSHQEQQPQQQAVNPGNVHLVDGMGMGQLQHDGLPLGMNGITPPPQQQSGGNGFYPPHQQYMKHTLAVFQQQRQIEEQLKNLSMGGMQQAAAQQQQQHHGVLGQMNGGTGYDVGPCQNNYGSGLGSAPLFSGSAISSAKSRPIPEEKELDFRFQEAQKALEELVESDSHMHNSGRSNIGSSQINGLVNSQCGNYLPPPPPGFVQPNTHMNSFGSKILPYLNMNSQQQQINTSQNSWPSNFSQNHQQQHKGMGMCNDWKILDPAILSSRRHIPNMPPILDPYAPLSQLGGQSQPSQQLQQQSGPQQRPFEAYNGGFSSYSSPLQQSYSNYSHLTTQQNLNWLGNEINTQISSPPGFRTSGQATKQQEC